MARKGDLWVFGSVAATGLIMLGAYLIRGYAPHPATRRMQNKQEQNIPPKQFEQNQDNISPWQREELHYTPNENIYDKQDSYFQEESNWKDSYDRTPEDRQEWNLETEQAWDSSKEKKWN